MLRGFYTATSGMLAQQRRQEVLANNIANQMTPGYKADQATLRAFPELLMQQTGTKHVPTMKGVNLPYNKIIGPLNTGVYVQETIPNYVQGDLRETGVLTDIAIVNGTIPNAEANIFFTVQNAEGDIRFTRNGNFTVDGEGMLVTSNGYYVLDDQGDPIQTNGLEFIITAEGIIQTGEQNIPLGISYIENVHELTKEGNDLFNGEGNPVPAEVSFTINQGYLEGSNVNALQTMTEMMESYRLFEMNQRVLKAFDESMDKAVNEIGRIG